MADTLLFRGGPSNDITASTVQSREIVIDTDTDQIVSGTSKKKTVMEDSSGDVSIGGGNIGLNATGDAKFGGAVIVGSTGTPIQKLHVSSDSSTGAGLVGISLGSNVVSARSASIIKDTDPTYSLRINTSNNTSVIAGDLILGDAFKERARVTSGGNFILGGTLPSAPNIKLDATGTITSASNITSGTFLTSGTTESGARLGASGYVYVQKPAGNGGITHRVYQGNVVTTENRANGDQWTVGDVSVGGTSSVPNIELNADGTGAFEKVGIGTSSPARVFEISSTGPVIRLTNTGDNVRSEISVASGDNIYAADQGNSGTGGNHIFMSNGSSQRVRFESGGDVLIGGTLPSSPNIELNADGSINSVNSIKGRYAQFDNVAGAGSSTLELKVSGSNWVRARGDKRFLIGGTNTAPENSLIDLNGNDGSATFAGLLKVDRDATTFATFDRAGATRFAIGDAGVYVGTDVSPGANPVTGNNISLKTDGSATFAGSVSIGGTAAANTIDEYEEGTCTVDLTVGASPAGLTGSAAQGTYTRIGDLCQVQINLDISSASVSGKTGNLAITGLPFASPNTTRSNYSASVCSVINWATPYADGSKTILATNSANSTNLSLIAGSRTTGQLDETALDFTSGTCKLFTTFVYRIA